MAISDLIAQIDAEIAKLQQAKTLLSGAEAMAPALPVVKSGRGRPKGSKNAAKTVEAKTSGKAATKTTTKKAAKRVLSPEGRKAIADAMKKRWEARRQATAKA